MLLINLYVFFINLIFNDRPAEISASDELEYLLFTPANYYFLWQYFD